MGWKVPHEYEPIISHSDFYAKEATAVNKFEFGTQIGGTFNWLQKPLKEADGAKRLMQIYYSPLDKTDGGEGLFLDECGYIFRYSENDARLFLQFG